MARILITGAAGFVGSHLAAVHAAAGDDLTMTDNRTGPLADPGLQALVRRENVVFVRADLRERADWDLLGGDFDVVYHLAAVNGTRRFYEIPHDVLRTNILAAINALDWFKESSAGGKVLFTSSSEVYAGALASFGALPLPTPEEVPLVIADVANPRWSYAGSKLVGEQLFAHGGSAYGLRTAIVRPHNFYGPRDGRLHVIPQLIERIRQRCDPFPILGPQETRSFCYIQDAAEALRAIAFSAETDGLTFHVGAASETKIADLADMLFEISGWRPRRVVAEPSLNGSVARRVPDVSRVKETVGWEATTTLEEGLAETYRWYAAGTGFTSPVPASVPQTLNSA